MHIRKGDQVEVLSGKDKGKRGKVLRMFPEKERAIVEGVNMIKKHTRPNPRSGVKGGIVEREAPVHIAKLLPIDPQTQQPTRIGHKFLDAPDAMDYQPRLRAMYDQDIRPALMEELGVTNRMAVPTLHKIVINMGLGETSRDPKLLDEAVSELTDISGQKPTVRKARKSIANFKLREGMVVGAAVTLRAGRMWEFFDRLVNLALPRVRDFRGVSTKAFDGRGNYTLGVRDQLIFPEVNFAKVTKAIGMNITIVTSARNDREARALLTRLGMPFAR